jgi:hypothetical protein
MRSSSLSTAACEASTHRVPFLPPMANCGLELLEFIRFDATLRDLPVLILTGVTLTSDEEATIVRDSAYSFYTSENLESLAIQFDQLTS